MKSAVLWTCLLAACGASAGTTRAAGAWRVVDLTHTLGPDMPVWPGGTPLQLDNKATLEKNGFYGNDLRLGEHGGTHVDAPIHFSAAGAPVEKLPVAWLVQQAAVIDLTARVAANPDALLELADVKAWEGRHGKLGAGWCVLARTGWSERWPDQTLYRNTDDAGKMHFPGVSLAAARYLREVGVRCLGVDTLSTDAGVSTTFDTHKLFLAGGGFNLENLTNLAALPEVGASIVVGVLPLEGGSGAPARVLALIPR
jgi:kynurenine formamidase